MINDAGNGRKRNRIFTHLPPEIRHALHVLGKEKGWDEAGSAHVREAVLLGLAAEGWSPTRITVAYLEYALDCERNGRVNQFAETVR